MAGEKNKGGQSPGGPSGQKRQGKIGQARKQAVSQGKKATKVGAEGALASYTGGVSKAVLAVIPTPLDSPEDRRKKTRNRRIIYALVAAVGIAQVAILALVLSTIFTAVFGGGGSQPESPNTCLELDLQKGSGGGPDAPRGSGGTGAVAGELGYPVDPGTPMTSGFGPRWGTNHNGQDFGAPEGSSLYAMADGEVVQAGEASGFDHWAVIRHELSNGEMIDVVYGHMDVDTIFVKQGDKVRIGDEIGQIGVPGNSTPQDTPESTTGAHFHLEIHPGGWGPGNAVDPKPYLDQFQSEGAKADRPPEGESPDRKASNQSGGDGGAERAGSAVEGSDVLLVGDSIGKRAEAALDSELPGIQVNARESRPFSEGADIIRGQIDDLPPVLVVELGTNGGLDADEYQGLVDEVHEKSPDTKVVAVNLWAERDWIDAGNKVIDGLNGVTVADWHSVAEDDPSLIDDGVHQTMQEGSTELARVIAEAVRSAAPEPSAAPRDDAAPAGDDEGGSDDSRAPPADTPPGTVTAADWEKLAECESGGKWDTNTGNGFFGGLQFTKQTWDGFGGGEYADMPNEATKEEQMEVANKILAEQGWGAWPSCTNNSHPELKGLKPAPEGSFVNGGGGGDAKAAGSGDKDEESPADKLQSDLDRIVGEARDNGVTLAVSAGEIGADAINAGDSGGSVYAASTIKVAIAATVEKKLKQDDDVDVENDDVVGGSGTGLEAGTYPVSELEEKMITASDNTATNALIDAVGGFDEVNKVIADAGVEGGYKLANKMMARPSGQSSQISAESARTFLDALFDASENDGGVIAKDQASRIVDLMKKQKLRDKLPADIPEGDVANKTGETDEVSHDIGFIWPKSGEPVSVAVTSEFSSDIETANGYIADIGKAIYDGGAGTESGGSSSSAAAPYEPEGDQLTTTLGPEEQANVKAIITAAKRSDLEPPERAASLATMLAGYETQWISQTEEDHENEIGIFAEAPLGGVTASQLEDPEKSAKRFMDRLKDVAEDNPNWATDPAADVLVAMYPSKAALQFDLPKWEEVSTSAVDELWDDENAQEGSRLERLADDVAQCSQGRTASSTSGAALAPGEVPEEFVKWIDLAGGVCDGIDAPLIAAQIEAESQFNTQAVSGVGAEGPAQFMPYTWPSWGSPRDENGEPTGPTGAGDPFKISDAVMAQADFMCSMHEQISGWIEDGSVQGDATELTIAGYNAGAGAVQNAGGMPSGGDYTTQTQPYVQKIMAAREKFAQKGSAPADDDRVKKTKGGSKASDGDFSKGEKALKAARKQEGKPYVFGANGPDAWDCSSLTQQAYKEAGIDLPRTTYEQVKVGKEIPMSEAQPGDLIFSNYQGGSQPEHVSMFVEDGRHYEAQTSGVPVGEHDMWASDMKVYRMY